MAGAVVAALGAVVLLEPWTFVSNVYFYDDQFYYFQIARNVAAGHGFTFDGLHKTNGFHPLWLFLLVAIFGLVPGDVAPLRVVAAVEIALVASASIGVLKALSPRLGQGPALVAALLVVAQPGVTHVLRVGMESSLLLCLLVMAWQRWLLLEGEEPATRARWLGLGWCCALAFLARLEAIVVLAALVLLARRRLRTEPWAATHLLAPTALCAVAYLSWNRIAFDTWVPISGMVKIRLASAFWRHSITVQGVAAILQVPWVGERIFHHAFGISSVAFYWPLVNLALLCLAAVAACRWREILRRAIGESGAGFVVLSCILIVIIDKATIRHLGGWEEVPILLATAVLGGVLVSRTPHVARMVATLVLIACAARGPLEMWHAIQRGPYSEILDAALWLRRNTTASERLGSWAGGGILGYFSGRHVVILDGLANDKEFFRRVLEGGDLYGYLRDEGVGWLTAPACSGNPSFSDAFPVVPAPPAVRSRLEREFDLVMYFQDARKSCPGYTLWRASWHADQRE